MPWITHMLFLDLNNNFSCKENKKKLRGSLIMLGFVWGRFVNYSPSLLSTRMIYVTTSLVQTWRSLCSTSPLFSKETITASKDVKTIINRGMCRFSVMPMGRLSVLSTPVAGSVTSHPRRVVFLIVFSLQPLTKHCTINGQTLGMKNYHLNPQITYV